MTDHEVERILGYTPCVCGVLDGTWHSRCYVGKTQSQIADGYKSAFIKARRKLKQQAETDTKSALLRARGDQQ